MAEIVSENVKEYLEMLKGSIKNTRELCGRSIYPGAGIVWQECYKRIKALPVDNTLFAFRPWRQGPTSKQKTAILNSLGIAKLKKKQGGYDVKLGFNGYSDIQENRGYRDGEKITVYNSNNNPKHMVPNAVIARTVNNGASNMKAHPFMDQAVAASRESAEKAIENQFLLEVQKFFKD